jgi:hypothetical protein
MADQTRVITRLYEKITCSFARTGGFIHNLIIISKLILYFWSNNYTVLYLITSILPDEKKNQNYQDIRKKILHNKKVSKILDHNNNSINNYNQQAKDSVIENKVNMSNDNFIRITKHKNENIIPNFNNLPIQKMESKVKVQRER